MFDQYWIKLQHLREFLLLTIVRGLIWLLLFRVNTGLNLKKIYIEKEAGFYILSMNASFFLIYPMT